MAVTEESLAEDINKLFSGTKEEVEEHGSTIEPDDGVYEFNKSFQSKIAALAIRDGQFNNRTNGLIRPEYFESAGEAMLVKIALSYYEKYKKIPDRPVWRELIKDAIDKKIIRKDLKKEVIEKFSELHKADISDRDYVIEKVADFARHQAIERAILHSVGLLEKGDWDNIEKSFKKAMIVGATEDTAYSYGDEVDNRAQRRKDTLAGKLKPQGIPTGMKELDRLLYHKGWGRSELSVYMGGAKVGKTTALLNAATSAWLAGYNVLYVTLEVSKNIVCDRMDASISKMTMTEIGTSPMSVANKIRHAIDTHRTGNLVIQEYPSGTMSPNDLKRIIERHKAEGNTFDLVCVDYLDIMQPNYRTDSEISNSKSIWVDVRAIAQEEEFAILSATQTNREGYKAAVAKSEHVADDFNKIRTADLVISINKSADEAREGQARLYLAASRNQAGGYTIQVQQDLERMIFVTEVLGIS